MIDVLKQINGAAMRGMKLPQQIKQAISIVKASRNPQAALMGMMQNNPMMKDVMEITNQHGGDPMKAFREMAEENGLDPDEILSMIS